MMTKSIITRQFYKTHQEGLFIGHHFWGC